jgi:hypothetical protein
VILPGVSLPYAAGYVAAVLQRHAYYLDADGLSPAHDSDELRFCADVLLAARVSR